MKTRAWVAAAYALAATTAWAQSSAPKVDPELQAAVTKFAQAFDAADAKAYAGWFTSDATIINPMGGVAHGPAEIEKLFAQFGAPIFKGSHSTMTITGSRQVAPDVVWLDVEHQVQNAHRPGRGVGPMKPHVVILAQKQGGEWKWAEMRAMVFVPRGRGPGPGGGPPPVRPQ